MPTTAKFWKIAFALAFAALQPAALAQRTNLTISIDLYNDGKYQAASGFLQEYLKANPNEAIAHYYLANCLMKLNKTEEALIEYRRCYSIDPNGKAAKACLEALNRTPTLSPQQKSAVPQTTDRQKSAPASPSPAIRAIDLTSRIPRFPIPPTETPDALEIMSTWSWPQKATYIAEASARKQRAAIALDQAQQVLLKAQSIAASIVPNARSYGESETEFRNRTAEAHGKMDSALAPYEQDVETLVRAFANEKAVYDECVKAQWGF